MSFLTTAEKKTVAGRARTLQERLDADATPGEINADFDGSLDDLIKDWRDAVADGDDDVFRRRLRFENHELEDCQRRIGTDEWPADEPLPKWIHRLDELLEFVFEHRTTEVELRMENELPFVDALAPFLQYAREQVDERPSEHVAHSAVQDLIEWLARRLTRLWSHTAFIEFKTYVANHDPDLVFGDGILPDGSTEYYDEFTERLLGEQLKSFVLEYSFLARLFVTVIRQWVVRVEEFYARVAHDWSALDAVFADGESLGKITDIGAVGDTHQGGREVFAVTFESGTKAAYKPRNAGIVVWFYDLLEWINQNGDLPKFRTLDFVYRDKYAWMEWVQPEVCSTKTAVHEYYRRAGMFICLFYVLAATDMHLENIVAEGSQPVAIDLETLAEPVVKSDMRSINETVKVVADTVIRTGVVPRHVPAEEVKDMSGFAIQQGEITLESQQFTFVNTDSMDLEYAQFPNPEGANLPVYDGRVVEPTEHPNAILQGFDECYRFLLDNRADVLATDGPLENFIDDEFRVRVLYRATSVYSHVTDAMRSPSYHRKGLQFGIKVEALAKLLATGAVVEDAWPLYESERMTLRRFNIPRFSSKVDSVDLYDADEVVVEEFFEQTPLGQMHERLSNLNESDLEEQLDYLRWGYGGHERAHGKMNETTIDRDVSSSPNFEQAATDASQSVFDRIATNARQEDDAPTWILREIGSNGGLHVHPIDDRLYDGRVGIGVFAAGLWSVTGDDRYRTFARRTVTPILTELAMGEFENDSTSRRSPPRPIGGGVGLGSIVYGLTKIGQLLEDEQYVSAATHVAELIGPDRIAADNRYGVLHGSAGAILGLLALYTDIETEAVLNRAVRVGDHLVKHGSKRDGVLTWHSPDFDRPLCGFSHGVAGIAYSLFRLGHVTGTSRFKDAAVDSIEYERRAYDADVKNWPDLRAEADSEWMDAWCHGRTGVGLARLGMYGIDRMPEIRYDAENAVRGMDSTVLSSVDHLCCGNFGRIELLLQAERTLGDASYRHEAERLATACIRRATNAGQFSTQWQTDQLYNPGFFGGEAGIGYSLLRFVDDSLPNVLLWE